MKTSLFLCLILGFHTLAEGQTPTDDPMYDLLVGTYTEPGKSEGIYVYRFNSATGEFKYSGEATGIKNPSYLCVSKDGNYVYSVNEVGDGNGGVSAFSFDSPSGQLSFINSASSGGDSPCYISVDDRNSSVYVGNYGGGSLSAVPIKADGSLGSGLQTIQHEGKSIGTGQNNPHVHATVLSPDGRYLFVPDLGTDKVYIYTVDSGNSDPLTAADPAFVKVKAGSGPRHFIFHPNGKYAYLIQEITGDVTVFDYKDGKLTMKQTISLGSDEYKENGDSAAAADIHISPDRKFLYGSLRGTSNELVIYDIDKKGKLKMVGRQSTLGKTPRNFALDPTGNFLLVGNSGDDEIVIFKRDQKTGLLTPTGGKIQVGAPVCLKFVASK